MSSGELMYIWWMVVVANWLTWCQGWCFLTGGVLDCSLARCRSVAELCMLFKIKSSPMHPFCGTLPMPYVSARVTRS